MLTDSPLAKLGRGIFLAVCAGITAATLLALNTEHVALLATQQALNAEHLANERLHGVSRADRDALWKGQSSLLGHVEANQATIARILDALVKKEAATP